MPLEASSRAWTTWLLAGVVIVLAGSHIELRLRVKKDMAELAERESKRSKGGGLKFFSSNSQSTSPSPEDFEAASPPPQRPVVEPPPVEALAPCTGFIAVEMLQTVVSTRAPEMLKCTAHSKGFLLLNLQVGSKGTVEDLRISGAKLNQEKLDCIKERVRSWRFPPPIGPPSQDGLQCAIVELPFALKPSSASKTISE